MSALIANKAAMLAALPPEWPDDPLPAIQQRLRDQPRKVVVLDDDPTGTQTVYGIPVLTTWSIEALREELLSDLPAFYVLTNSRSMPLALAQALNAEIGRNLVAAARAAGVAFTVISRSDSTLRGHFPGEVDALASALGGSLDATLLIPAFLDGGRYTIGDVHYVAEGEQLVGAGETAFARDAAFGYRASNLREWVAEKTLGRVPADAVASISIEDIRARGSAGVAQRLLSLAPGSVCVVNAAGERDLAVVALGLLDAEAAGRRFLLRTAASFVRLRAGLAPRPLLGPAELELPGEGGGLIVVGSYVPTTSGQLAALLAAPGVNPIEVDVAALLSEQQSAGELRRVAERASALLEQRADVVIYTSRELRTGADAARSLAIGQRVSEGLVAIVRGLGQRPRYLIAKGGITSSDLATQALGVRRAMVLGQALPGVPVWRLGPESRYPGLAYIVFPGNVGGPQALADLAQMLRRA